MITVVLLALATGTPTTEARPAEDAPLFSRVEPAIAEGSSALAGGDTARALEQFRKAKADTPNQRAIVEYDVGQALALQALASASPAPPSASGDPAAPAAQPQLDKSAVADAQAAFGRARSLAHDPRVKAEAALAAGNLAAMAGNVDDAIAQFRQALTDDPANQRAKKNLRRALEAKKQQQQQQQRGGDQNQDDQNKQDQRNDEQQGDQQQGDKKQNDQKKDDQDQGQAPKPEQQPQPQPGDEPDDKKAQKKEAARRLLDALRARERPLTPLEMRGAKPVRAKEGKDW